MSSQRFSAKYHRSRAVEPVRGRFDIGNATPPPVDPRCVQDLAALRDGAPRRGPR